MADISTVRHPEWETEVAYRSTAWDVYRGGRHVVAPSKATFSARFMDAQIEDADVGEDEARAVVNRALYRRTASSSYLHSHVREQYDEYNDRVSRAVHIPVFRSIVDVYVAAVLRTDADRSDSAALTDAFWPVYWGNVDLAGTQIDTFFSQALTYALVYKKAFAVTDRTGGFGVPAASRGAQINRGERAYSYLISPSQLVDWSLDRHGRMIYGVVEETEPEEHEPGTKREDARFQYRVWRRDRWDLYRQKGKIWTVDDGGAYPSTLNEVPIAPIYARRGHESRRTMSADGILSDVLDMDLNVFNLLSLFHDQIYAQVFAQLVQPSDGHNAGDVELGPKRVLLYEPESGAPHYIQPNHSLLLALWQIIMDEISITRQMASTSRGRAEYSREERSAAALQAESGDKSNAVSSLVGCVEEFDRTVHRHAAAWEGIDPKNVPRASYSRDVSLKALSAQIEDATKLSALQVPQAAMSEVYKPLVARMLREHGQGEEAILRAQKSLDALAGGMEKIAEGASDGT